jgi:hypothetical protein
MAFSRLDVM